MRLKGANGHAFSEQHALPTQHARGPGAAYQVHSLQGAKPSLGGLLLALGGNSSSEVLRERSEACVHCHRNWD